MNKIILLTLLIVGLTDYSSGQNKMDSLRSNNLIKDLISYKIDFMESDSVFIISGTLFSDNRKHKMFRISNYSGVYIQVYPYSNDDQYDVPIFNERIEWMNFIKDTVFDINGDGNYDLAINWQPTSGCCPANIYDCYIYDSKLDQFSKKIELSNPTFIPEDSVVYSMDYNHPSETIFYKMKWTNNEIDSLKSYSWNKPIFNSIIIKDFENGETIERKDIPNELKRLNGFEWFIMKPENFQD